MDRHDLVKPSSPSDQPRQAEIRELDAPLIEIKDGVVELILGLQIIEKKQGGEAPFENIEVQVKVDGARIAGVMTDDSGLIEAKRVQIEKGKSVVTITVPGTTAVYRRKIGEIMTRDFDEERRIAEEEIGKIALQERNEGNDVDPLEHLEQSQLDFINSDFAKCLSSDDISRLKLAHAQTRIFRLERALEKALRPPSTVSTSVEKTLLRVLEAQETSLRSDYVKSLPPLVQEQMRANHTKTRALLENCRAMYLSAPAEKSPPKPDLLSPEGNT